MHRRTLALFLGAACCTGAAAQNAKPEPKPLELSLGWNYAYTGQGDGFANVNGWYGALNWGVTPRFGLTFSHESFWGAYRDLGTNVHVYLLGTTAKLRKGEPKVSPFLQPFGSVTRASYAGSIEHQPTFQLAAGADIKLKGKLSFEVIPAEYVYTHGSAGNLNTFQVGAGLQYTFGK